MPLVYVAAFSVDHGQAMVNSRYGLKKEQTNPDKDSGNNHRGTTQEGCN